jgi:hypothetical protein
MSTTSPTEGTPEGTPEGMGMPSLPTTLFNLTELLETPFMEWGVNLWITFFVLVFAVMAFLYIVKKILMPKKSSNPSQMTSPPRMKKMRSKKSKMV